MTDSPIANLETVHVVICTHVDIGYTDPPDRVEWKMKEMLDDALRFCREDPEYHYTIETAYVLRHWYNRTDDPRLIDEMRRYMQEGRIELCAAYTTQHSPFCGPEDLNQLCYDGRRLGDIFGVRPVTVMQDDVPGYTWAYPQILRKSGIKYFLAGVNTVFGGKTGIPHAQNPFLWEGVDGSRVLLFERIGYCHFCQPWEYFRNLMEGRDLETIEKNFRLYLEFLGEHRYPYDTFCFIANMCDNLGPIENVRMVECMRAWNASGRKPRFVLSTPRKFFEHMESKYSDTFQTHRGDWPSTVAWNMVKPRGPLGTLLFRRAQTQLPIAEKVLAIASLKQGSRFPAPEVRWAYDSLVHYGEHSAPEGPGDHRRLTRRESYWINFEHFRYAYKPFNEAESLLEIGSLQAGQWAASPDRDTILVFNPTSAPRTDVARARTGGAGWFSFAEPHLIERIEDLETGESVPFENAAMSELGGDATGPDSSPCVALLARDVPPMGFRAYRAVRAEDPARAPRPAGEDVASGIASIENEKYRVEVDAATGMIVSLFDKERLRELTGRNEWFFNTFERKDKASNPRITVRRVEGATFQKIEIHREDFWACETDIRLDAGSDRVEWRNVYDRMIWRRHHPGGEGINITSHFPLAMQGEKARIIASGPNGFRRLPDDLLPGCPDDHFPTSAFVAVEDDDQTVVMASPGDTLFISPLRDAECMTLRIGTILQAFSPFRHRFAGEEPMSLVEPETDGRLVFRYALTSHDGPFDPRRAQGLGWNLRNEMLGVYTPSTHVGPAGAAFPDPVHSCIRIDDPAGQPGDVAVAILRQSLIAGQDFHILRLQEMIGGPRRSVRVLFAAELALEWAAEADITERKGSGMPLDADGNLSVEIGPFETVTLALGFRAARSKA